MQILKNPNFNFIKYRWHALVLSWVVILAGVGVVWMKGGLPESVEFSGGTVVIAEFDRTPAIDQVRAALDRTFPGGNVVVQAYGAKDSKRVMVRVPQVGKEQGADLGQTARQVEQALKQAPGLGYLRNGGTEVVGPSVGADLKKKGLLATVLSLGGILIYIAFRYELSFAVGAIVASAHDLLVTMAFLAFFGYDLSLNVIAAVLTLSGYSMNDTIVIFDRVRENLRGMRRDNISEVVNVAVNQTLNRTIITGGTVLLSVVALFLFGGEVLHGFAFTMIVGVITGTYSSVFIAAAIVTFWRRPTPRAKAAAAAGTAAVPAPPKALQTERSRAKKRK
jgi:preprotein translocase subunit SecF